MVDDTIDSLGLSVKNDRDPSCPTWQSRHSVRLWLKTFTTDVAAVVVVAAVKDLRNTGAGFWERGLTARLR